MSIETNKKIADFMGKRYDYLICDNCGKQDPELLMPGSGRRLTKCCSTYDKEHENCFYSGVDEDGVTVYSIGKTMSPINSLASDLKYHISWDWLMPVVEKIEVIKFGEHTGFTVGVMRNYCVISCHAKNRQDGVIYQTPYGSNPTSKIEALYAAVIAFITEFNLNTL